MDQKARANPADAGGKQDKAGLTPDEQTSKLGDLGRGSHEQTQGLTGEPPKDLPGDEPPPKDRP